MTNTAVSVRISPRAYVIAKKSGNPRLGALFFRHRAGLVIRDVVFSGKFPSSVVKIVFRRVEKLLKK
jgi:hypothetical protein